MTGRRAATLATGTAALLLALLPASPAAAGAAIAVDGPVVSGASVTISGSAEMTLVEGVTGVTIRATSVLRPDASPPPCEGCGADVGSIQRVVSFTHTFDALAVNGPYEVSVEVLGRNTLNGESTSDVATEGFRIEVPPATPTIVSAAPGADGTVAVTWTRNTEPDLAGYRVERRALGGEFGAVGALVPQPTAGPTVRWTDTTAGLAGGRFEYQVVALRPDGEGSGRMEAASSTIGALVPTPGTPGNPGAPGLPGGGTAPSSRGPGSLPSLASGASADGRPLAEPDGTFSETLPFGARNNQARGDARAAPDDAVVILGRTTNKRAILLPIAAGLFMCVAAAHLRRLSRRMFPPSLEAGA